MNYICADGKMVRADAPVLMADNKSYRYGDGLFETMKVFKKNILLEAYHINRLFEGITALQLEPPVLFSKEEIAKQVLRLCEKNACDGLGRIRLSIARGNGGMYDTEGGFNYIIESWPLNKTVNTLNENGLILGLYTLAQKSCDHFSGIKSANFLPYVMAARYAKANKCNDCLVINTYGRVADATIANVFVVKDESIVTPPLSEGCVNGVMRKYLLEKCREAGYGLQEKPVAEEDILSADEVFLTNVISGIRWVKSYKNKLYTNGITREIYQRFLEPLYR